ncbi:MAG: 1-pyrroline-5-carboxylate dehydrogenase [Planctomycetota bacterium]|jgi:1-pyrroline-5-carboxylate dehydrogenase
MTHGVFQVPTAKNEPIKSYAPASPERAALKSKLKELVANEIEVPLIIGGKEVRTGNLGKMVMPHNHGHTLGTFHKAGAAEVKAAIDAAENARGDWDAMPWQDRAAIFLRAAEMLATTHRDTINASTMLNQSKTAYQAEIDSACELIDFYKFNVGFAQELYQAQPQSSPGCWNRLEHRPLDGFVFAVTPFNFTSIAGNLPTAPALLGNTCLWKPASTSVYSNWFVMKLLMDAGMPAGVINFLPGSGADVGDPVVADPRLAGIHFTGSTRTFQHIWKGVGANIANYKQYPRLVGETGGKDFIFAHPSAGFEGLVTAIIRGSFEYQGQKCSAASRAYIPRSLWSNLKDRLVEEIAKIKMGDVCDFRNFMGALIDQSSFNNLKTAIESAKADPKCTLIAGGECDDSDGYFVAPTVIEVSDPMHESMRTEYFGPLMTIHVYEDDKFSEMLAICDKTADYALTGAILADDRAAVLEATRALRYAAGNFYINDKPTGAVVGQQPFGGSRASGTNDKAGSVLNLLRWTSQRTIKETFVPATEWSYPFMDEE